MTAKAKMPIIPMEKFGKDHWSLLGYIENCCVNGRGKDGCGEVVHSRMRDAHRDTFDAGTSAVRMGPGWEDEYSTRLKSFPWKSESEQEKAKHRVSGHDDWNCLEDLEQAGLAKLISYVNGFVQITDAGLAMVAKIRVHKAQGGKFSNFTP